MKKIIEFKKGEKVLITKKFNHNIEKEIWFDCMDRTIGKIGVIKRAKKKVKIWGETFNCYKVNVSGIGVWEYNEKSLSKVDSKKRSYLIKKIKNKNKYS